MTAGLALGAALALTGCNTPHNDVLVFGTSTLVGVDIKPEPETGAFSAAIGYRREEAVWMPLLINGEWSRFAPQAVCAEQEAGSCLQSLDTDARWQAVINDACPAYRVAGTETAADCLARLHRLYPNRPFDGDPRYVGRTVETETDPNGGTLIRTVRDDAYSVFASIGADISAGTTEGKVGVAQFFATGPAAQALAENEDLADALAIRSVDERVVEAEHARAEAQETLAGLRAEQFDALAESYGLSRSEALAAGIRGRLKAEREIEALAWIENAGIGGFGALAQAGCGLSPDLVDQIGDGDIDTRKTELRNAIDLNMNNEGIVDSILNFKNGTCSVSADENSDTPISGGGPNFNHED